MPALWLEFAAGFFIVAPLAQRLGLVETLSELPGGYLADYANLFHLLPIAIEEQHSGRAEQLVAIQQRALFGIAIGDVEADQAVVGQARGYQRVGKDFSLDHLAADAPVRIPVEQQRLPGSMCRQQLLI